MNARWIVPATLVLALAATGRAGDGDAPAKSSPAKPAADAKATKKAADEKDANAVAQSIALLRPAPKDLDDAMRRLSRMKVNVRFDDTPFAEIVDYLRRVAGFNVIVAPALQFKGLDGIKPITLGLTDVTLRQVVEFTAQFSGTKLKFADGMLQFTTPEDARGKPVLRIIAIGDLTMRLHNFPGPELDLRPAKAEFTPDPESDVENAWSDPQKVVEMIQKMCGEGTWSDKDVSISADANKLIVKQYPEVQREIGRLLMLLRAAR